MSDTDQSMLESELLIYVSELENPTKHGYSDAFEYLENCLDIRGGYDHQRGEDNDVKIQRTTGGPNITIIVSHDTDEIRIDGSWGLSSRASMNAHDNIGLKSLLEQMGRIHYA